MCTPRRPQIRPTVHPFRLPRRQTHTMQALLRALADDPSDDGGARLSRLLAATDGVPVANLLRAAAPVLAQPDGWKRLIHRTHALHPLSFRLMRRLSAKTAQAVLYDAGPLPPLLEVTLRHKIVGTDHLIEQAVARGDGAFLTAVGALFCRHGPEVCGHYYRTHGGGAAVLPDWWRRDDHFVVAELASVLSGADADRWAREVAGAVEVYNRSVDARPTLECLATVRPILGYPILLGSRSPLAPHAAALALAAGTLNGQDLMFIKPLVVDAVVAAAKDGRNGERAMWWLLVIRRTGLRLIDEESDAMRCASDAAAAATTAGRLVWRVSAAEAPKLVADLIGDHRRQYPWDMRIVRTLATCDSLPGAACGHAGRVDRRFRMEVTAADGDTSVTFAFAETEDRDPVSDDTVVNLAVCADPACAAANAWAACAIRESFPALTAAVQSGGGTVAFADLPNKAVGMWILLHRQYAAGRVDEPLTHVAFRIAHWFWHHCPRR